MIPPKPLDYKELTPDQQKAHDTVERFMNQDEHKVMTITGYAGTGKTTLLANIVELLQNSQNRITVTAPTNKAVKVLSDKIGKGNLQTIHKALNVKPVRNRDIEVFEPVLFEKEHPIVEYDYVIVDECSMVSVELKKILMNAIKGFETKVIFTGDQAQLPPVGEDISPTFLYPKTSLDTIVRHDDTLAHSAALFRNNPEPVDIEEAVNGSTIRMEDRAILKHHFKNWRKDPDSKRMIAWTNNSVKYWNELLRQIDWQKRPEQPWIKGDIIIANSPCFVRYGGEKQVVLNNSEEATVRRVIVKKESYKIMASKENGSQVELEVVKEEHKPKLQKVLKKYAAEKNWYNFWRLKEKYHDLRHCYSMTAHKSQGSTFGTVFVDIDDISRNPNIKERNKLLYTAITRASKQVIFIT